MSIDEKKFLIDSLFYQHVYFIFELYSSNLCFSLSLEKNKIFKVKYQKIFMGGSIDGKNFLFHF